MPVERLSLTFVDSTFHPVSHRYGEAATYACTLASAMASVRARRGCRWARSTPVQIPSRPESAGVHRSESPGQAREEAEPKRGVPAKQRDPRTKAVTTMRNLVLVLLLLGSAPATGWSQTPSGKPWVASSKGKTYYWSSCTAAQRLSPANRLYFASESAAEAAGYRLSATKACRGPSRKPSAATPNATGERTNTHGTPSRVTPGPSRSCAVASVYDGDTLACADGTRVPYTCGDPATRHTGRTSYTTRTPPNGHPGSESHCAPHCSARPPYRCQSAETARLKI